MRLISALAVLVVSFVLVACDDGLNHDILDSKQAVLAIVSEKLESVPGSEDGLGTGFFIDENVIITNKHVVEKAGVLKVANEKGSEFYEAEVINADSVADIAVIKIKDWEKYKKENSWRILKLAHPDDVEVTQQVYAIGHPWGLVWSVSKGIVSAVDRKPTATPKILLQVDAHVFQGNSGGPLLNERGEVLGINSLMISQNGGSYGFAAPVKLIEKVLRDFEKHDGQVRWAFLGIKLKESEVAEVTPESAAEKAGIQKDDKIIEFTTSDGTFSVKEKNLAVAMATHDPDLPVKVVLERAGERLELSIEPTWKDSETVVAETSSQP